MEASRSKSLEDSHLSPPRRKGGLFSGSKLKEEIARSKEKELTRFQSTDPRTTGRGAEPVYRDSKGQRTSKIDHLRARGKLRKEPEWAKGLVQKRRYRAEVEELKLRETNPSPFARNRDDPELEKTLKERVRWGDPMSKRQSLEHVFVDLGDDEKMKASGFVVPQEVPGQSWVRRGVEAAPNRYGIRPGRHWDGVDRSINEYGGVVRRPAHHNRTLSMLPNNHMQDESANKGNVPGVSRKRWAEWEDERLIVCCLRNLVHTYQGRPMTV